MNLERPKLVDDGMPGVVAAVEARDVIHALGEIIHDLALAFITPLRTDHSCDCHKTSVRRIVKHYNSGGLILELIVGRVRSVPRPTGNNKYFVYLLVSICPSLSLRSTRPAEEIRMKILQDT